VTPAALQLPPVQQRPLAALGCTIPFGEAARYDAIFRTRGLRPEVLLDSSDALAPDDGALGTMADLCRDCGGGTCHAPFVSMFWDTPDETMRRRTVDVLFAAADVAARLGVVSAVLHPNWDPRSGESHDAWMTRAVPGLARVTARFVEVGVRPLLENVREYEPAQLLRLLAEVHDATGICIDPGHAAVVSDVPVREWFAVVGDRLGEIHMHNNDRTSDQHRSLDQGTAWDPPTELQILVDQGRRFFPVLEPADAATAMASLGALASWGLHRPPPSPP